MWSLASFDIGTLFQPGNIIFLVCGLIAITAIVAPQVLKSRQASEEARLKSQMIKRGFSADEIERVIRTGANEPDADDD